MKSVREEIEEFNEKCNGASDAEVERNLALKARKGIHFANIDGDLKRFEAYLKQQGVDEASYFINCESGEFHFRCENDSPGECHCCGHQAEHTIELADVDGRFYIPNENVRRDARNGKYPWLREVPFCHSCMRTIEDNMRATIMYLAREIKPFSKNR